MSLLVERPGLLTTVQDMGRNARRHGVVRGGVMDTHAARIANILVGNDERAAVLEATLVGPRLRFTRDHIVAVTGAVGGGMRDWQPFSVAAGDVLDIVAAPRAYVAVAGGIDVPVVLGSRATDITAGFGGLHGRALIAADVLDIGTAVRTIRPGRWGAGPSLTSYISDDSPIRIIEGPEHALFTAAARESLISERFEISTQSNRMGYRLRGPQLELAQGGEMLSSPVTMGTVQVPPSGGPIVLMADGQTVGGYPRIAHVISADLPRLAQRAPGSHISFRRVTIEEAQHLYLRQEQDIRMFSTAVALR